MPRARTLDERIAEIRPEHARAHTLGESPKGAWRFWGVLPVAAIALLLGLRALLHTAPLDQLAPAAGRSGDPASTTAYTGSLAVERGGPVIVGFQSELGSRLVVGDREARVVMLPRPYDALRIGMSLEAARTLVPSISATADADGVYIAAQSPAASAIIAAPDGVIAWLALDLHGRGLIKDRAIILHGPTAIRFAAAPGARLVWSPVGRRGEPEYLPANSLSPEPPARAAFSSPGAAPLDGGIALAILAVIVATLCVIARRRLAAVSRDTWIAMAAVLAVALVARLVGLGDQGQTWDEDVNWSAGRNYVTNLLAFDFADRSWQWNYEHPPIMKMLDGIGAQLADGFGPARALSALWVSLGCALLVPIGARLYRFRAGVLAAAIAALLPPLVAHGQIVGHEAPTVLWWSLGILLALGAHDYLPANDRRALRILIVRLAWIGVVVGIAIASRFVNGFLGPVCALIVVVQAPARWRRATLGWGAAVMPLAAIATVYVVWPRLWLHPIAHLQAAFAKLSTTHSPEPFMGAMTATPSATYFLAYLVATLPIGLVPGVLAWLGRSGIEHKRWRTTAIVVAWFAIPLIGVMVSPVRQDGVRYVMPCVVALALISAAGFDAIAGWIKVPHAFTALAAIVIAYLGVTAIRTAPYFLDYFAEYRSAGDIAATKTFETAWWGEGVDRAVDYVNANAEPDARVYRCIEPAHLAWFREDLWLPMTTKPREATWFVVYAPATQTCPLPADARNVFEVAHDGGVLSAVYRR
ncbi:MAG: glycosyltransferase family 39 protein [Kofleriaceae bacterium]